MAEIPVPLVPSAKRIVREIGANRLSKDASQILIEVLEDYGERVAKKSVSLAKNAGRKKVNIEDILEAVA